MLLPKPQWGTLTSLLPGEAGWWEGWTPCLLASGSAGMFGEVRPGCVYVRVEFPQGKCCQVGLFDVALEKDNAVG